MNHVETFSASFIFLVLLIVVRQALAGDANRNVSEKSLREWHKRLMPTPSSCGKNVSVEDLQCESRRLREPWRPAEMEREMIPCSAPRLGGALPHKKALMEPRPEAD